MYPAHEICIQRAVTVSKSCYISGPGSCWMLRLLFQGCECFPALQILSYTCADRTTRPLSSQRFANVFHESEEWVSCREQSTQAFSARRFALGIWLLKIPLCHYRSLTQSGPPSGTRSTILHAIPRRRMCE